MDRMHIVLAVSIFLCATVAGLGLQCADAATSAGQGLGPIVSALSGKIRGEDVSGTQVTAFEGIPYAAPPVGPLRWRPPERVKPWRGVLYAHRFGDSCMQATPNEVLPWTPSFMTHQPVSEDCLFLNVWTPSVSREANLPVVVFIHGGGFSAGAGSIAVYNGAHLASRGAVVVTLNYRLGVFGFFASKALSEQSGYGGSGNYGLMDQIAALRWVHANIRSFGGDPDRVTIWGQSAGAISVGDLVLSPRAKGLFQRAQADSGISMQTIGFGDMPLAAAEANGEKFARTLGTTSLSKLRSVPADVVLAHAMKLPYTYFLPTADGYILPGSAHDLTVSDDGSNVPLVLGWNADDWHLGTVRKNISLVEFQAQAHKLYGGFAKQFLALYPAATDQEATNMDALSVQDRERVASFMWAQARMSASHNRQKVYMYYFGHEIPWPQHPRYGAFHTSEIPYFFGNLKLLERPWTPEDFALSDKMAGYLIAFASTGDPNGAGLPSWKALADGFALWIGDTIQSNPIADPARVAFWEKFLASPQGARAPMF